MLDKTNYFDLDPVDPCLVRLSEDDRPLRAALLRGWRLRCPNCGTGRMMEGFLKVRAACPLCHEAFYHHRDDEGPALVTILMIGHLMAPLFLYGFLSPRPDAFLLAMVFCAGTAALSLFLLPRWKGMMVARQWSRRMHGFGGNSDDDGQPR
ncbi:DUF983 domain-containing protein [Pseudotabrizicola algicola]|uniref:DUF983 domain-containing protein n=1 Tax=Pseudotabrizicola algicola TaxID=2709381 RepID=A0A6B3RKJ9_9RHOB|nr:DUF983 domain-containing protein [Pseudotabrizicola algicola]NEX45766.1 DUF983 domain-containing protein [Pseudotabrizicola algicola]